MICVSWPAGGPQIIVRLFGAVFSCGWPTDYGMRPWYHVGRDYMSPWRTKNFRIRLPIDLLLAAALGVWWALR